MARIHYEADGDISPDRFIAALTDFSSRRPELWPNLSPAYFKVNELADTWADVQEGTAILGGVWARERYDWSEPGRVTLTLIESPSFRPGTVIDYHVTRARWRRLSRQRRLPANRDQPLGQGRRSRRPARRPAEVRGRPAGNPGPDRRPRSSGGAGMTDQFPVDGMELTHLLVVSDLERSRAFYHDVLGATVTREYGGSSCVLRFLGTWLLLVTAGPPTEDKPTVTFAPPDDPDRVAHELTIRVPDCRAAHATLTARGAIFLAPPSESAWEIRAFFRDPDGHLIEISEVK